MWTMCETVDSESERVETHFKPRESIVSRLLKIEI